MEKLQLSYGNHYYSNVPYFTPYFWIDFFTEIRKNNGANLYMYVYIFL